MARQRGNGRDYAFYPYSSVSGGVILGNKTTLESITDLSGKRIGVAGGELDKNWLLLSALYRQKSGNSLQEQAEISFAAPPLLSRQLKAGQLDLVLTYWHFAARLEAEGFKQWGDGSALLQAMQLDPDMPFLGYVFRRNWAEQNRAALNAFLRGVAGTRTDICQQDAAWQMVIPLTRTEDDKTLNLLRQRYCRGQVENWENRHRAEIKKTFETLKDLSQSRLTGGQAEPDAQTFWSIEMP